MLKEHIEPQNGGIDDDILIVLELPENDHLFEKKKVGGVPSLFFCHAKSYLSMSFTFCLLYSYEYNYYSYTLQKLLQDIGHDPKGHVTLKSSSTPDQLKPILEIMLQRARIINLDEVLVLFSAS